MKNLIMFFMAVVFMAGCSSDDGESKPSGSFGQVEFQDYYIGAWETQNGDLLAIARHHMEMELPGENLVVTQAIQMGQQGFQNNLGLAGGKLLNFTKVDFDTMTVTYSEQSGEIIWQAVYDKI